MSVSLFQKISCIGNNDSEIETVNYIAKDKLTGILKIVRKVDNSTLYEEEITLEANRKL